MDLKIAVQPDNLTQPNGERQSYSARWKEIAAQEGVLIVEVDVYSRHAFSEIAKCDAFMWRFGPMAFPRNYGLRLLLAIEKGLGIPVYPSQKTAWHFEDKILQSHYFSLAGIPVPKTEVFWRLGDAEEFCDRAAYPFVLKLASGFRASNVRLIHDKQEALYYARRLFGEGLRSLDKEPVALTQLYFERLRAAAKIFVQGKYPITPTPLEELHHGYFYTQEFLPGNDFDTRVIIIGNRAFAFRRFNRPNDFRASGSGLRDRDPKAIDERALRLAYEVCHTMGAQTVSVDIAFELEKDQPVVLEMGVAYASWLVRDCPGHWILNGAPDSGKLEWREGQQLAEDLLFRNFVAEVRSIKKN